MTRKLLRLTEELYSQPHLISQDAFKAISIYLTKRNEEGVTVTEELASDSSSKERRDPILDQYDPITQVGILYIHGALTYKPVYGLCGATGVSYESLLRDTVKLADLGAKTIIMDCASGGGEGYGAFECAKDLRSICDEANIKLIAYNDGCIASACYALACVADEIITNPSASTGSIGVLIALYNDSKYLEKEGYTRTFVTAGKSKIPFAEDGSFKEDFLADLQYKVDAMYQEFCEHVSQNMVKLSVEDVKKTEAKMFLAKDALKLGLVDKIMTRAEFAKYMADMITKREKGGKNA